MQSCQLHLKTTVYASLLHFVYAKFQSEKRGANRVYYGGLRD